MANLIPLALMMLLTLSPVLIPLGITAVHAIANRRRKAEPVRPVVNPERAAS